jgi:hypothetical protein
VAACAAVCFFEQLRQAAPAIDGTPAQGYPSNGQLEQDGHRAVAFSGGRSRQVQRRALIEALGHLGASRVTEAPDGHTALRTLQASFTPASTSPSSTWRWAAWTGWS